MPKYDVSMGDPIDALMEEAAEIIQAIGKYRRFGPRGTKKWQDEVEGRLTPHQQIIAELGDLLAVVDILVINNWVTQDQLDVAKEAKFAKLEEFFGFKREVTHAPMPATPQRFWHDPTTDGPVDVNSEHYIIQGHWQPGGPHTMTSMWKHGTKGYVVFEDTPDARRASVPIAPWTEGEAWQKGKRYGEGAIPVDDLINR